MRRNVRGSVKTGCLFYLIIFAAVLYVGYKFGEVQWNYVTMKEKMFDLLGLAVSARQLDHGLYKKTIIDKAEDIGFEIDKENIKITEEDNEITFEIYWVVPIEFPGYTYYKQCELVVSRKKWL